MILILVSFKLSSTRPVDPTGFFPDDMESPSIGGDRGEQERDVGDRVTAWEPVHHPGRLGLHGEVDIVAKPPSQPHYLAPKLHCGMWTWRGEVGEQKWRQVATLFLIKWSAINL